LKYRSGLQDAVEEIGCLFFVILLASQALIWIFLLGLEVSKDNGFSVGIDATAAPFNAAQGGGQRPPAMRMLWASGFSPTIMQYYMQLVVDQHFSQRRKAPWHK
jgi:hypothetical protein